MLFRASIFVVLLSLCAPLSVHAAPVWGSDASGELVGSRDSSGIVTATTGGIDGQSAWDNGGLTVSWIISETAGIWTYEYTLTTTSKEISHWIIEVTQDDEPFNTYNGTSKIDGGAQVGWAGANSNPGLPNDFFGIKFNAGGANDGGLVQVYTIVTDREPVYGVAYWKDGVSGGTDVVAWTNSLNAANYKTNLTFTTNDFIVRPNGAEDEEDPDPQTGGAVPEPAAGVLLLIAGSTLLVNRRRTA